MSDSLPVEILTFDIDRKFAAAFYEESPEVDAGTSLPPSDVSGLDVAMPTPLDSQSGLPQETPVGKDDKNRGYYPNPCKRVPTLPIRHSGRDPSHHHAIQEPSLSTAHFSHQHISSRDI